MDRRRSLLDLPRPAVAPSILAADFAHLADEIARVESEGADMLHLDAMDGHFVPNLAIGPVVVEKIRPVTSLLLDVHLMLEEPARFVEAFARAGADSITFHAQAVSDAAALTRRIHELGCAAAVAVNPDVPLDVLRPALPHVDMVVVMTVFAGFGGQPFLMEVVPRIRAVRGWLRPEQRLEVDGGISPVSAGVAAAAGADTFAAGTAIFRAADVGHGEAIAAIRGAARRAMAT